MADENTTGTMISRAIQQVPDDPNEMKKFLRRTLRDHYQDIKTLFETCTDCDIFEEKQRGS